MSGGTDLWSEMEARYNKRDYTGWALLFADDAVLIDPTGRHEGPDAIKKSMEGADKPFTESRNETSLLIEEGDTFVAEWIWRATHTETGKGVEVPGASVVTMRDGKVANRHDYFDVAAVMGQTGLMPGT